jgi:transglutaminase-like putative cysteine protease
MSPVRRARPAHHYRQTHKWLIAAFALVIVAVLVAAAFLWNSIPTEPAGFTTLKNHYISLMQNLNSTQTKTEMAAQLNPKYNQTDLFTWEHSKLTFVQDPAWTEDAFQILSSGKGICVQWSIVYVSACLALHMQSRLVVAVDTSTWTFIHTWAEDYYNGSWVHVDPSDSVWNDPSRYLGWDWGQAIGGQVRVYAFTDNGYVDVTQSYMPH